MQNHRVVWPQQGIARLESFEVPVPAADEVLIRTRVSLISPGTERAFFLRLPNAAAEFPLYPGYSLVGEVSEVGAQVHEFKIGDRIAAAASHTGCAVVKAAGGVLIPDDVGDDDAAFFMLGAIALQGVRKAHLELGEAVIVMGAGLVGVLAMQLAKSNGGLPVICIDQDEHRLAFALEAGADAVLAADENLTQSINDLCGTGGATVVIEATGNPHAILTAFALAQRGGRVVLLGSTRGETEHVNFYRDVHQKGLTILGAHNSARPLHDSAAGRWTLHDDQEVVLKLLSSRRMNVHSLITHRFVWQQAADAYALLAQAGGNTQGILLDWQGS
ncbi:MAG TPA: zinc-binding alcohol dehydrogenase [Abditibacteriaceae bacterium]|nr:zinc-binding alcohol dehydrogenase [Abditibacteriaceae bacterium]